MRSGGPRWRGPWRAATPAGRASASSPLPTDSSEATSYPTGRSQPSLWCTVHESPPVIVASPGSKACSGSTRQRSAPRLGDGPRAGGGPKSEEPPAETQALNGLSFGGFHLEKNKDQVKNT